MNTNQNQQMYANQNQQGQVGAQQAPYEPLRLVVEVPEKFGPTFETKFITSKDICKKISGLFKNSIGDFFGCTLLPNPTTGQLELCLFLKDLGQSDKVKMVEPVVNMSNPGRNDMGSRIANLNSRNAGKTMQLTQEAKELFEEFLLKPNYNSKVNWNAHAVECSEQLSTFGGKYNIYIKLYNLNLNAVIAKIWGEKAAEGGKYDYNISPVKQIPGTNNFVLTVQRYHNHNIEEFASQVGLTPTVGSFDIVQ